MIQFKSIEDLANYVKAVQGLCTWMSIDHLTAAKLILHSLVEHQIVIDTRP